MREHVDKLRAQAAEAARDAQTLERLADSGLLDGLAVKLAYAGGGSQQADACATVTAPDRAAAAAIAQRFIDAGQALPCAFSRHTFATFKPVSFMSEREAESIVYEADDLWPVKYTADPFNGGPCSRFGEGVLHMWIADAKAPEFVVALRISIQSDPCGVELRHSRGRAQDGAPKGAVIGYEWHDIPGGEVVSYSSGTPGKPGHVMVMFWREPGAGPTVAAYLDPAQSQAIARKAR